MKLKQFKWLFIGGLTLSSLLSSCGVQDEGDESRVLAVQGPFIPANRVESHIRSAGFPSNLVNTMRAIAQCESSLGAKSYAIGGNGLRHTGLFQISDLHQGACGYGSLSRSQFHSKMTAPALNARCAYVVYRQAGSSLAPWDCYRFGSYARYL